MVSSYLQNDPEKALSIVPVILGIAGIAVGLVLTATQLIVLHEIIFLTILGYVVKDKMQFFD